MTIQGDLLYNFLEYFLWFKAFTFLAIALSAGTAV